MRTAYRTDANQKATVKALRAVGCSVDILAMVGKGVPDLAVGRNGKTVLMEVKMPGAKLTKDETLWHARNRGCSTIVYGPEGALDYVEEYL